jgi:hypothetical protein
MLLMIYGSTVVMEGIPASCNREGEIPQKVVARFENYGMWWYRYVLNVGVKTYR